MTVSVTYFHGYSVLSAAEQTDHGVYYRPHDTMVLPYY